MADDPVAVTAAGAIRAKAGRLRAAAPGEPEKQRQADALHRLAALVDEGVEAVQAAFAPGAAPVDGITDADRRSAAELVYSLALQRESQGLQRNLGVPLPPGWETGGLDLPIHRATLREAADLFALALALEYESFRDYSRGFVLESLGDFAAAARAFDGVAGSHAAHAVSQADRCRRKHLGTWDAEAESQAAFAAINHQFERTGPGAWLLRMAMKLVAWSLRRMDDGKPVPRPPAAPARVVDRAALDRGASVAQVFAEHLVDGDFAAAHALLARPLQDLTADGLREAYVAMTVHEDDADDADADAINVLVMSSHGDMPELGPADLAWVYVAITGATFNEAITVVVTDEDGEGRIRELEWGRP